MPSADADTRKDGEILSRLTSEVCPLRANLHSPFCRSHTRTVLFIAPEQAILRLWSKATLYTIEKAYNGRADLSLHISRTFSCMANQDPLTHAINKVPYA